MATIRVAIHQDGLTWLRLNWRKPRQNRSGSRASSENGVCRYSTPGGAAHSPSRLRKAWQRVLRQPLHKSPSECIGRMRRKLKTKAGKAVYAARKTIVEPVFGQIKHARGFRQFLLRGIDKVRAEWSLVCLTHNVLKLYRLCHPRTRESGSRYPECQNTRRLGGHLVPDSGECGQSRRESHQAWGERCHARDGYVLG